MSRGMPCEFTLAISAFRASGTTAYFVENSFAYPASPVACVLMISAAHESIAESAFPKSI